MEKLRNVKKERLTSNFKNSEIFPGLYCALGTVGTFLVSKELFVFDHEWTIFYNYVWIFGIAIVIYKKDFTAWLNNYMDQQNARLKSFRQDEIDR